MEIVEFLKAYKDFGYLGLFIATLYVCYREMKSRQAESTATAEKSKAEVVAITEKVTKALDISAAAINTSSQKHEEVTRSVEAMKATTSELVAVLKDRDRRDERSSR